MKLLAAFEVFVQEILAGKEGVFFSIKNPKIGQQFVFGTGNFETLNFDDKKFPNFAITDFLGKKQQNIYFENWISDQEFKISQNFGEVLQDLEKNYLEVENLKNCCSDTETEFVEKVKNIQAAQKNGEFWVANLAQKFSGNFRNKSDKKAILASFSRFLKTQKHHCGGVVWLKNQKFVSFSPEVFLVQDQQKLTTYPIKGTGQKAELLASEKEISELYMVTDLLRNDLGQICKSVIVENERFLTDEVDFFHAQAEISGDLGHNFTQTDLLKLLPAGSITGAPKKRVCEKIMELEKFSRDFYTGTFGIRFSGKKSVFNILIRTIFLDKKGWNYPVASGITIESIPSREYIETYQKAKLLKNFVFKQSINVGIQGGLGSNNERAGKIFKERQKFPRTVFEYLYTSEKVLEAVFKEEIDFGVFAVKSTSKLVEETQLALQKLGKENFEIIDKTILDLDHVLLENESINATQEVLIFSHPQALLEHEDFLKTLFPKLKLCPEIDTALAGKFLKQGKYPENSLVITPRECAEIWDLKIHTDHLPTKNPYRTEFWLVRKNKNLARF